MNTWKFVYSTSLCIALSLVASGCIGDTSAGTPTETSGVSKPNTSPSVKAKNSADEYQPATKQHPAKNVPVPRMPEAASRVTPKGAEAFVDYYFDLINYTIETNTPEPIMKSTTRNCELCGVGIIDPAVEAREIGKWQVGGKHHHVIVDTYIPSKNKAVITVRYRVDESEFYIEPGQLDNSLTKMASRLLSISLVNDDGWKVDGMTGVS